MNESDSAIAGQHSSDELLKWAPEFEPLVPIVVGVTGHRDIHPAHLIRIQEQIRTAFKELRKRYPSTPIVLLSPLAEGADRLTAKIALEPEVAARLIVPLPLPKHLYINDFRNTSGSAEEFENLAGHSAATVIELPLDSHETEDQLASPGPARDLRYALAGAFIAKHCQILFALWDGDKNNKMGGTSHVIQCKLEGIPPYLRRPIRVADPSELGPVYHFHTPRKGSDADPTVEYPLIKLFPKSYEYGDEDLKKAEHFYDLRIFGPIEEFNAESPPPPDHAQMHLTSESTINSIDSEAHRDGLRLIGRYAERADALSLHFQPTTLAAFAALSILVAFSALCLDVSTHILYNNQGAQSWIMLLFPLLMCLAFVVFRIATERKVQDRYQDYRALAEGLRVQFYWLLAGVHESVSDHYLGKHRSELFWVRHACRNAYLLADRETLALNEKISNAVVEDWVKGQLQYYRNKVNSDKKSLHFWHPLINFLFWSGLIVAATVALIGIALEYQCFSTYHELFEIAEEITHHSSIMHQLLILYVVMSAVVAALAHNYVQKAAFEEHLKQFGHMVKIFEDRLRRIQANIERKDFRAVRTELMGLGQDALAENGEWVLTHRERPLEVPHH